MEVITNFLGQSITHFYKKAYHIGSFIDGKRLTISNAQYHYINYLIG